MVRKWTTKEKIGVWVVGIAIPVLAICVRFFTPDIRKGIGLDKPEKSFSAPASKVEAEPSKPMQPQEQRQTTPPQVKQQSKNKVSGKGNVVGNNTSGNGNTVGNNNQPNSVGSISQGPCSSVQIGGSNNQQTTNCAPQLRIPDKRIDELAKLLSTQRGTVIISVDNASETTLHDARNLLAAFSETKQWNTKGINTSTHPPDIGQDGVPIPPPIGIHISARSECSEVQFVRDALKKLGIESVGDADNSPADCEVSIVVGAQQ